MRRGGGRDDAEARPRRPQSDVGPGLHRLRGVPRNQTLNGGGGDAPEVTADGLRLEALDKDKPVKLDGVPTEWPPFAKAGVVDQGGEQVVR